MKTHPEGSCREAGVALQTALIVTAIDGIEETAAAVASRLALTVEIASSRAAALRLLDRRGYAVVIVDQMLADSDPEGADLVWKAAGLAIPLQISFALAGTARMEREVRAALARRQREQQQAAAAASAAVDAELKNAVTSFLLESQLALAEEGLSSAVEGRLRNLVEIAARMRDRLGSVPLRDAPRAGLLAAVN